MSNLKVIIEAIKLVLMAYKFIKGEIKEREFNNAVNERKELRNEYLKAERAERLKKLKELQK